MEEVICPNCKEDISQEDWSFFDEWYEQKINIITCPLCNVANDIYRLNLNLIGALTN
jgi:uncharacterized protein YbaR (Trm112 family)